MNRPRIGFALLILLLAVGAGPASKRPVAGFAYQEKWSPSCEPLVKGVLRVEGDVKAPVVISRNEAATDLKKYNIPCPGLLPVFEILLDEKGIVRCVRILHLTPEKPSDEFMKSVRSNVMKWKFKPATVDGKPVAVLFGVTINFRCQ